MGKEKPHNKIEWFDKLRLNSWEVEILIVGFVLVMLLQIPDTISLETDKLWRIFSPSLDNFAIDFLIFGCRVLLLFIVGVCVDILIISLSLFLGFRGFWVGVLGLSSVYPNGINFNEAKFIDRMCTIQECYLCLFFLRLFFILFF